MSYKENDRLTSLPRKIRIIILSFLPTKFAVATAILSTSWRHLWINITALRFAVTDFPQHKFNAIFLLTIRRVIWRHINVIELIFNDDQDVSSSIHFPRIIHDVVYNGTNVKEFKVTFKNYSGLTKVLPCSIFKKPSLEVLEVYADHGVFLKDVVNHTNLNLRKLVISLRECDLKLFDKLVKSCPLLEILRVHVEMLKKFNSTIKIINAQNLKCLIVNLICKEYTIDNKIMLDAPKLQYFEVHSPSMVKFCFLKTPIGLLKAKLFMGDDHPSQNLSSKHVLSVFNPIFRVKTLKISGDLLVALSKINGLVEVFHKLSHLEMGLSYTQSWRGVKRFLEQCPNVECLVLKRTCIAIWDDLNWSEIKFLPRCLHNKIQRIELWNFGGSEVVLQVLRYILSVAKALKKLHITILINGESANQKEIQFSPEFLALSEEFPSCEITTLLFKDGQNIWSKQKCDSGCGRRPLIILV